MGLFADGSDPEITDCTFIYNYSPVDGGGLELWGCNSMLRNCIIIENTAASTGGGLSLDAYSDPFIINSVISRNQARDGAGILCFSSTCTLVNCIISGNVAIGSSSNDGGGINVMDFSVIEVFNCLIEGNSATRGGAVCLRSYHNDSNIFTNCTIVNNTAIEGGGFYLYYPESLGTMINCIIRENLPEEIDEAYGSVQRDLFRCERWMDR